MTIPFEQSRLGVSVQIYAPSPWVSRRKIRTGTLRKTSKEGMVGINELRTLRGWYCDSVAVGQNDRCVADATAVEEGAIR